MLNDILLFYLDNKLFRHLLDNIFKCLKKRLNIQIYFAITLFHMIFHVGMVNNYVNAN